jgi:hypothetical protein
MVSTGHARGVIISVPGYHAAAEWLWRVISGVINCKESRISIKLASIQLKLGNNISSIVLSHG